MGKYTSHSAESQVRLFEIFEEDTTYEKQNSSENPGKRNGNRLQVQKPVLPQDQNQRQNENSDAP